MLIVSLHGSQIVYICSSVVSSNISVRIFIIFTREERFASEQIFPRISLSSSSSTAAPVNTSPTLNLHSLFCTAYGEELNLCFSFFLLAVILLSVVVGLQSRLISSAYGPCCLNQASAIMYSMWSQDDVAQRNPQCT